MSHIIDRRKHDRKGKSSVNRLRFIKRYRKQIQKSVSDSIAQRNITDINEGETIVIPNKDISEPSFKFGREGKRESTHAGNKEFLKGDKLKRPTTSVSQGSSKASNKGIGQDDFVFQLSKDEFLDIFFDEMELPNLVKTRMQKEACYKYERAGFSTTGTTTNINIVRSMRGALGRRIAIGGKYKRRILELNQELKNMSSSSQLEQSKSRRLHEEIKLLERKIDAIPYIDSFDIRYNYREAKPTPSTQAVMFCIMDVSGSMDEVKKEMSKRFFMLLYLFLQQNYKYVNMEFIRHHTTAKQVDEDEFFYSRETGGTVVSSALSLTYDIINQCYNPDDWNIYVAQASDGDNWNADSPSCKDVLEQQILPLVQYFAYIEVLPRHHQSLWECYERIKNNNFSMQHIKDSQDIYPVLRELFKRRDYE